MPKKTSVKELQAEMESLRQRAELAEETLAAIQRGEVDALVISHPEGQKVFTLCDADHSYRLLVEQMNEGAVTVNESGDILFCNRKFSEMTGYPHETISGRRLSDFFHEQDHERLGSCLRPQAREGAKAELNLKGQALSLPVLLSSHCFQLDGISARACVITDIKKKQDQINETLELFKTAIDNYPAVFIVLDVDRRIRFINSYAGRISGLTEQDIVGLGDDEFVPGETLKQYEPYLEKALATLQPQGCECSARFATGMYNFLIDFVPILDTQGRLKHVLVFGYDIGDFKRTETSLKHEKLMIERLVMKRTDELVRAKIELEKSQRLSDIGQLAATVAHELRNPLAAIHMAGINISRKSCDPRLQDHLATIQKKVVESDQIINNLLFYSRLKSALFDSMNMYDTLEESINACRTRFPERAITFRLEGDEIRKRVVCADRQQLKEAFVNILNNAADAIPSSVKGLITISVGLSGKRMTIRFTDNGIGMDEATRARIFEPFFTTKSKGTGLGLTVCERVLKHHNGAIDIESAPGKGTTVTVTLPAG